MAYMIELECKCGRLYYGNPLKDKYCPLCEKVLIKLEKEKHFKYLDSLTIKQRLKKIEKWIYDYKPKYVPPPTY